MTALTGINNLVGKFAEQGLQQGTAKEQQASAVDQMRLKDALHGPSQQNNPAVQPSQPESTPALKPTGNVEPGKPSLGTSILQSMDKMRSTSVDVNQSVGSIDNMSTMSPQELLKAQMQISRVMFNEQALGSVTGKVEQDADSLLKSQ